MNFRQVIIGVLFTCLPGIIFSQNSERIREYIDRYKEQAISEMQRTGVPASIKLAQGIHETQAGASTLVQKSNNHFGIKCKSNWTGESVSHDDDAKGECFRKYKTVVESYRDHSDFLKYNNRYAFLFSLSPLDYKEWANGLKKAGYATNPRYPQALIKLIEDYQLQDYTLLALEQHPSDSVIGFSMNHNTTENENKAEEKKKLYPEDVFSINATKVIYVKKGISYLVLAQKYNIPLSRLFEFNEIEEAETAAMDQLLFLQRKRKTGVTEFYIVLPGDDLHGIAQSEGIRLESLLEYNGLKKQDILSPGEKLYLQKNSKKKPGLLQKGTK